MMMAALFVGFLFFERKIKIKRTRRKMRISIITFASYWGSKLGSNGRRGLGAGRGRRVRGAVGAAEGADVADSAVVASKDSGSRVVVVVTDATGRSVLDLRSCLTSVR